MRIPNNMTENQVMAAIEKIVNILAPNFKFGYYDVEDIKQEARIFGMNVMKHYDEGRPLENFLYKHIKNRLINLKRDKYCRPKPPCLTCAENIEGCDNGQPCARYLKWLKRNQAKKHLLAPLDIENISNERESNTRIESSVLEDVERDELLQLIDIKLPVELRSNYLQMRAGAKLPKGKREEVEQAVLNILKGNLPCLTNEDR